MHTTTRPNQRPGNRGRTILEFILSKLVNRHTKRIIFVTSLYTRVSHLTQLEASAVAKLNQLMVLATNEESLSFSSRLQNIVWGRTHIDETLTPEILRTGLTDARCEELSTKVVDMSPRWLRYEKPRMIQDVANLLRQSPQLAVA